MQARGHVFAAGLAPVQDAGYLGAHACAGERLAQVVQFGLYQPLVQGPQAGVVCGDVGPQIGLGQQKPVGCLPEAGQHAKRHMVGRLTGSDGLWRGQLHSQRAKLPACEPAAQREQCEQGVFDTLARNGAGGADVRDGDPVAACIVIQREGGAVRDHRHMAREVLKTHQQVGAGRQRVAHHIHTGLWQLQRRQIDACFGA